MGSRCQHLDGTDGVLVSALAYGMHSRGQGFEGERKSEGRAARVCVKSH